MTERLAQLLTEPDQAAVSALLEAAFSDDPAYRYFLKGIPQDKIQDYRKHLVAFIVAYHCRAGMAVWGLGRADEWHAFALMETPVPRWRRFLALCMHLPGLFGRVPWVCIRRMNDYARVSRIGMPSNLNHYLVKIGVAPELQGQGCGKQLIAAIQNHYRETTGEIGLDTENSANVPLYEHLGFKLIDQQPLEEVIIYRMRCQLK